MLNARVKSTLLFLMFIGMFLIHTQYTDADLFAERNVKNNKFTATSVNFFVHNTVNGSSVNDLYKTVGIVPSGYDLAAVKIKREGSTPLNYRLKTVKTNGDDAFCNSLNMRVMQRNFTQLVANKLTQVSVDGQLSTDEPADYIFYMGLDDQEAELKNKICEFNLTFRTYRMSPNETGGIYAERVIRNVVSSGNW